jgi:anti-sigma factor RsiW
MNEIDPAELSGLLDGELPPDRAAQVRAAIEADPARRAEYQRLCQLHAAWSAAAASAVFRPRLRAPGRRSLRFLAQVTCGLLVLGVVRFVPKFTPALLSALVPMVVLTVFLGWVLYRSMRATDADCDAIAMRP